MQKNVIIISTSPRKGGNSDTLADQFAKGALKAGHKVEKVSLSGKNIQFCKGCLACQKIGHCVISDDMAPLLEKMKKAQVIAFATPIYFYEMSGQLKTFLDRTNPLFPTDYAFRDIYFLASAAEDETDAADRAKQGLTGWIDCFGKATLKGSVLAHHVTNPGDIQGHTSLQKAFEMGKNA